MGKVLWRVEKTSLAPRVCFLVQGMFAFWSSGLLDHFAGTLPGPGRLHQPHLLEICVSCLRVSGDRGRFSIYLPHRNTEFMASSKQALIWNRCV